MNMALALVLFCLLNAHAAGLHKAIVSSSLLDALQAELNSSWSLTSPESAVHADFEESTAIVTDWKMGRDHAYITSLLERIPHGRLLQVAMDGYEWLNFSAIPTRYAICNVHNSNDAISEYVLGAMLSWNVRLPQLDADFRRCTWQATNNTCKDPPRHVQTKGQTVGIIGFGNVGRGVATRAAAIGMRLIAVTKDPPSVPPSPLAWIGSDSDLPRLMQESDFVVVTVPLFPSTVGLVSPAVLSHMKSSGVLINVARAPIVDESGLYEALKQRRIGGAILDVWWNEMRWVSPGSGPSAWPSKFNFSALPNVWMTPHISWDTPESHQEGIVQVAANLRALASGLPLQNVVRNASRRQTPSISV